MGGRQALGKIQRNHHADESAADALQQPAEEQRFVSVREGDDRNTDDKRDAGENHQRLAADPVGQQPGEQCGNDAAQQHRRNNDRQLRGVQARGCLQVWQRAADDAHIDAVQQAAQAGNDKKKEVITALGGIHRQRHIREAVCGHRHEDKFLSLVLLLWSRQPRGLRANLTAFPTNITS